ncbi:hypothetical protein G9G63_09220 [Paenibacillus sp. EKM202P]|uniref:hypothetical protein n=1 Tax=unclassified Paenibacillus TaxID=185978 RepID=UPI0013EB304A|nr:MULTISPECIES: hypothetical protein [unclassified Paenibacillus]KAF6565330.1 hypothetical protein G9G63_09220 [Paenibacillus sp. EKM202P]KAF6569344.1 hypothetical protein G9G64_12870 [Paenibacillus sp. EKM207P]
MAERLLKCPICGQYGRKVDMIRETDKRHYHREYCHEKWKRERIFKQKEQQELDSLIDTIVKIHKLQGRYSVPKTFYPFIQDLRNDSVLFGRLDKKYKQGTSYEVIKNTYEYCSEKIEWARGNKEFKTLMAELKYCFAIVKNNIENSIRASRQTQRNQVESEVLNKHIESMSDVHEKITKIQISKVATNDENDQIDVTTLFD